MPVLKTVGIYLPPQAAANKEKIIYGNENCNDNKQYKHSEISV